MEVRGFEQDLIPYVGQLVLANVSIEGWVIDSYEWSWHWCVTPYLQWRNCPIWCDDLGCWHDHRWRKVPEMYLKLLPKGPYGLPYLLLITFQSITLASVYYSACKGGVVFHPLKWTSKPTLL